MDTLEQFRLPADFEPEPEPPKRTRRQTGPFVRGPIPLAWLEPVLSMRGRTPLALALALRYQSGLERSNRIRVTRKLRERFGLSRRSVTKTLRDFEAAGLVRVTRPPGSCVVVEIVE